MAVIMSGKEPALSLAEKQKERIEALAQRGITVSRPCVLINKLKLKFLFTYFSSLY